MILGIDLGTTYSAVATVGPDGRAFVLPNEVGEQTTPSVVHFESCSSVLVGTAAVQAGTVDPDNTVSLIKRQMGSDFDLVFHGVRHTPESVSALILRALVNTDEPVRAVITVPAYFGIREREATAQAARLAGIEVLELLSEPVAAALYYGTAELTSGGGTVLVYDLGGGTFDTTVLKVQPTGVSVIATDGDSKLGGADWDARIAEYLTERFAEAVPDVDPFDDDDFPHRVQAAAESAKRALSTTESRPVVLRACGASVTVTFDREILERLGADLVDRTMSIVRRVIGNAARYGTPDIRHAILVGGSSKMPAIAQAISEELTIEPRVVQPDLAVVLGAAIRAHQMTKTRGVTTSVVPRSFGILVHDSYDPEATREMVVHVVHQNQPLPAETSVSFCTVADGRERIRVQVYEQAGDLPSEEVGHNRRVLDGELTVPPLPAGSPIEITFRVDADGRLTVTAREPGSGARLDLQAYVDGVVDASTADDLTATLAGIAVRQ
uniref:Chaperone protein DnaK n=1 Tax=uncultured bacterium esnapd2 TaxID=1366601 RepID=S5UAH4_9BACT|nr:chaperone protein DnaK [uncultured bacterium esnapd2]